MRIAFESFDAPIFVSWQMTRDCNIACRHCCTGSAPGRRLDDELDQDECVALADELIRHHVPYVMLCGGEPTILPHFLGIAERLGQAGIQLKIETNGQRFDSALARSLSHLPVRSVQVSLDADDPRSYARQRPGGSLARAHDACRRIRDAGLPLEITFAPTRQTIGEAEAVIERALQLGAFRFNTGRLMRIGTAARHWAGLEPSEAQYAEFRDLLQRKSSALLDGAMKLYYAPFSMQEGLARSLESPPATLLILPNGWVKLAACLPQICADLRRVDLSQAWQAYRRGWRDQTFLEAARRAASDEALHAAANDWEFHSVEAR